MLFRSRVADMSSFLLWCELDGESGRLVPQRPAVCSPVRGDRLERSRGKMGERRLLHKSRRERCDVRGDMVRVVGLEPTRLAAQEPKSCVSTNSTIPAYSIFSLLLLGEGIPEAERYA